MNEAPFNTLHDGAIVGVSGSIPGDILLVVECQYLRERLQPPGLYFVVRLHDCRGLVFEPYDENSPKVQDLHEIAELELDIFSADADRSDIVVCCGKGDLRIQCQTVSVWLDNNHSITQAQLQQAARIYWNEWESNQKKRS